jgi:hypothetical protein
VCNRLGSLEIDYYARLRAALVELDEGDPTEGHELDRNWRVPKAMIGHQLSQEDGLHPVWMTRG